MKNSLKLFLIIVIVLGVVSCKSTQDIITEKQWVKVELYFGAEIPGLNDHTATGACDAITDVSDDDWCKFMDDSVAPRFKNGFTAIEGIGGWQSESGAFIVEKSRILIFVVKAKELDKSLALINEIINEYTTLFNQESVMRIMYQVQTDFLP